MRAAAALVPGISTLVSWVWVVGGMCRWGHHVAERNTTMGRFPCNGKEFSWEEMSTWEPWWSKAIELFSTD